MQAQNLTQKKLIRECVNYLKKCKKKNINTSISPLCFLTTWANTPGRLFFFNYINKSILLNIFWVLKNIFTISYNHDLKVFFNKEKNLKNNKIIISYCLKKNFDRNGNFYDSYFNVGNNKKNYLWFLVSLDGYIPQILQKNIFIIKKKNKRSFSFFYLLKKIFKVIIDSKFSFIKFTHTCWYEYDFAIELGNLFKKTFYNIKNKKILINYEGIPWQNLIINQVKKEKINKIIGYLHCAPWPVQTDLIYKGVPLDLLLVSSIDQKKMLYKYLGWKKSNIKIVPSLRFFKNKRKIFNGYIFPPYNLEVNNSYLERFESFLIKLPDRSLNHLKIRIHPLNLKDKKHLKLKKNINNIMLKYKNKFTKECNKNYSIFFGSATGVCVQALEEGTKIIHFPNDFLDVFSNELWPNIITKKIDNNVYVYSLKKYNKTFYTNFEKNKFNKFINLK